MQEKQLWGNIKKEKTSKIESKKKLLIKNTFKKEKKTKRKGKSSQRSRERIKHKQINKNQESQDKEMKKVEMNEKQGSNKGHWLGLNSQY